MYLSRLMRACWLLAVATVATAIAATLAGCSKGASQPAPLLPVRVSEVQTIDPQTANTYSANIQPYAQVDLSFKSSGYLDSIRQVRDANGHPRNIDQGDWVTKGTVLATVQQDDFEQKLAQAKAQLDRSQADHDRAKLQFDRVSVLYAADAATKPDYDNANAQQLSTQSAIDSAKASINEAQIALDYCQLRAPFDGWIVSRNVDLGALVGPTTKGFVLADTRSVKAVFGVPDTAIARIRLGSPQTVTTDALPGNFDGHVTSISPAADPKSRVYSVEVTINNPKNQLKSGMIASLSIGGNQVGTRVTVVPLTAVVRSPSSSNGFAVFLTEGNSDQVKVHTREVKLGDAYGNMIAVVNGVNPGDHVVTTGATMIKEGDQVRIIP